MRLSRLKSVTPFEYGLLVFQAPASFALTMRSSRSPAAHSDVQHSAPARAWLRHSCPISRSVLNAAYLGVSVKKDHANIE